MKAFSLLLAVVTFSLFALGCASHERTDTSAYHSSSSMSVTSK
jgi:hypothetical protein